METRDLQNIALDRLLDDRQERRDHEARDWELHDFDICDECGGVMQTKTGEKYQLCPDCFWKLDKEKK